MAPIPHVRVKKNVVTTVRVAENSADLDAVLRKIRRQKKELMDYADAIGLTEEEIDARMENLGAAKSSDIESMTTEIETMQREFGEINGKISDLDDRVTALEEEQPIPPEPEEEPLQD